MKGFLRYKFRAREGDNAICYTCRGEFVKGDEIVRTRSNGYQRRHASCYVDAHGKVMVAKPE